MLHPTMIGEEQEKSRDHMYEMEKGLAGDANGHFRKSVVKTLNSEAQSFKSRKNLSNQDKDYISALELGVQVVDAFWNMKHEQEA